MDIMNLGKLAIISRHTVLPQYDSRSEQESVPAVILVDGETITRVERCSEDVDFGQVHAEEVQDRLQGWTCLDYRDFYVSPGLIDCNVVSNPAWQSRAATSQSAVAGGVTFYLEEDSLYESEEDTTQCFCDVGKLARVTSLAQLSAQTTAFAYKVYLYPPSSAVGGFSEALEDLFDKVMLTPLPVFVDCSLPPPRMLYMASPYRHSTIEERISAMFVDESRFGAGAYQEEEVKSSESNSADTYSKPGRCHSTLEELPVDHTPQKSTAIHWERLIGRNRPRGHTEDLEELSMPDSTLPNLISDLNKRIDSLQDSQCDLIACEQHTYDQAGKYVYAGSPVADSPISKSAPASAAKSRPAPTLLIKKSRLRPKPLSLEKKTEEDTKERDYILHLGACPDHWEVAGVEKVLRAVRRAPCRVHFCNVSSAAAVNKVRIFKENKYADSVTVETTTHYLYFMKDDVCAGDTRLKAFPPIRNRSNCNLLWELLKVKAIDVIASRHIAVPRALKFLESGNFKKALSGVNGVEAGLKPVWTKLRAPSSSSASILERYIVRMAKWMSLNPAHLLGVSHKRGSIEPGKFADFLVWSPSEEAAVTDPDSPYCGKRLFGRVKAVYVRGVLAYEDGVARPAGRVMTRAEFYR